MGSMLTVLLGQKIQQKKSLQQMLQMTLPAIQELANGPREASLLRTPSPSYRTRNPKRSNRKYLKAAKQRQTQGKIAMKAKKTIDLIAEKTEEKRRKRIEEEES